MNESIDSETGDKVNKNAVGADRYEDDDKSVKNAFKYLDSKNVEIINSYNKMIYQWYFLLNAGGIVGAVTLLGVRNNSCYPHVSVLCVALVILFILGVVSVLIAAKLEMERFEYRCRISAEEYEKYINKKMDSSECLDRMNKDYYPSNLITIFEWLSLILFLLGIIIAIGYFTIASCTSGSCS